MCIFEFFYDFIYKKRTFEVSSNIRISDPVFSHFFEVEVCFLRDVGKAIGANPVVAPVIFQVK